MSEHKPGIMRRLLDNDKTLWLVYTLAAVVVSIQKTALGFNQEGYTAYENYRIFKNSFTHLAQGLNPYTSYPAEQWDLYKYSPAFALLMAPFAALPDNIGLILWNLLNALPLLWVVLQIPLLTPQKRHFLAWFILPELVIALQNSQSNGLTAMLLLWPFVALEQQKPVAAAVGAAGGGFLKIFGIFAAVPALVYPQWRKYLLATLAVASVLAIAPLILVSPAQLIQVYRWWIELLREDHSASLGLSVLGWLESWFGWQAPKLGVTLTGLALLAASVLAVRQQASAVNRTLLWASVLLWVVIFNHKAESPTFVIALCGVGLWYWGTGEPSLWKKILFWTAFVLASLTPTDIFPRMVREQIVQPYVLKAVPCIAIWSIITWRLLSAWTNRSPNPETPANHHI